ncbi:UDP-N-acetylmuramoyl-L-alanine--D-glutamate ligase [Litorimonas sp. WD9-15]|uniref:UDP-N-acetylmuramoyl-L-alanine--D-glutamate ligase n=1 Tax=Litorimonas sp. WD9-15 TaxID=3418716 RepID=UPI003D04B5FA
MIKAETFRGRTVAVFGLGRTGVTAALSLAAGGATVWAWDDNADSREAAEAQGVTLKDLKTADWLQVDDFVLSPGVPHHLPKPHWSAKKAKAANVPVICDIEILAREVAARAERQRPKIIAITGTNGKSTTTSLIGHILKSCGKDAQIGGNIGRGVLDLDRMHSGTYYVIELSSYQLERTQSLRANAAIFLNLSPDHLDRHGTLENYGLAKQAIFVNQTHEDTAVIGVDDDYGKALCTQMKVKNGRSIVPVSARRSLGHGVSVLGGKLFCNMSRKAHEICDLQEAKALEGRHNWQNAAAAYAAVSSLGLDAREIGEAILSFPGLAHRMETVGTLRNVRFVNDSKATNADAARQALASYENIFWIAGGVAKEGGIEPLADLFGNVRTAYLIGEAADDFGATLDESKKKWHDKKTLQMALLCATKDALESGVENPIVLLSPACASFDQFKNFEVRGDAFRTQVETLMGIETSDVPAPQEEEAA